MIGSRRQPLDADTDGQSGPFAGGNGPPVWAYTTKPFAALEHRFVLSTTDELFGRMVDHLYAACASSDRPQTCYGVVEEPMGTSERSLYIDGERIAAFSRPSWLLRFLAWHINHGAIASSTQHVLLHAAAVAVGERGVILPGPPDAGKTTLAAGLVRAGLDYLTDEATAINPGTLKLDPYAKPLSLDPGSWHLFPSVTLHGEAAVAGYFDDQWKFPADAIREGTIVRSAHPALVVFPRYEPGAETHLRPLRASESLARLARYTFSFLDQATRNLHVLGGVARSAPSYELVSGNLDGACAAILRIIEEQGDSS